MRSGEQVISWLSQHKKPIFVVIFVIILAIAGFNIIKNLKSAALNIYVAPASATVKIDGKTYKNGTYMFFPGKKTATISADGFAEKQVEVDLKANNYFNLFTYLNNTSDNLEYYKTHPDDMAILEQIIDDEDNEIIVGIKKIREFCNKLPITKSTTAADGNFIYAIINKPSDNECTRDLMLSVSHTGDGSKKFVEAIIKEKGFNPADYRINYEEF